MLFFFLAAVTLAANGFAADLPPVPASTERTHAEQELERVRQQADAGLLPKAQIAEAQQAVDDAMDEEILDRTLYAHLQVEDLNEQQATDMVSAAERRVARIEQKAERGRALIANKVAEPFMFAEVEAELARRRQVVEEAKGRASLLTELAAMAHAEASEPQVARVGKAAREEHVDGDHVLEPEDVKAITLAFEKEFHEPFPVSARGATAVHRAMGFDHTGRIDVALTPDSREGVWLRKYLEAKSIPYYAFRTAIAGKATAAHIHIGPGSTRIHAD
jgi:hypothetical protein